MNSFFCIRKKDWVAAGICSFAYCALQGGFVFAFDWLNPWLLHRFAQTFQPGDQTPPEIAEKISALHLLLLQKRQPYLRLAYYSDGDRNCCLSSLSLCGPAQALCRAVGGGNSSRLILVLLCQIPCGPGDKLGWYTGWRFDTELGGRNSRDLWGPSADELLFWGWIFYLLMELLWLWLDRRQTADRE